MIHSEATAILKWSWIDGIASYGTGSGFCDFISEGHLGRHLCRVREVYSQRLSVLLENARQRLGGLLEVSNIEAGLQTVGWLDAGIDEEAAAKAARARQVEVIPLSWYDTAANQKRKGLQLGFAACMPNEIRRGVRELAIALEDTRKRG